MYSTKRVKQEGNTSVFKFEDQGDEWVEWEVEHFERARGLKGADGSLLTIQTNKTCGTAKHPPGVVWSDRESSLDDSRFCIHCEFFWEAFPIF